MGEMKRFFTGMHISRTKLYSDSVHLFLCNKYVCFLDRVLCGYVIHFMTLLLCPRPPTPASEVWEWGCQVPVKASLVLFRFFFSIQFVIRV